MQELMQRSGRGVSYCLVPHGMLSLFCDAILSQMSSSGITHSELCPPISIIIKKKKVLQTCVQENPMKTFSQLIFLFPK